MSQDTSNNNAQADLASFGLPASFGGPSFAADTQQQQESQAGPARARGRGRGRGGGFDGRGRGRGRGGGHPNQQQQHSQRGGWQQRGAQFDNDDDPSLAFDRPAKSFFKPSFLEDPWAHLS